MEYLLTQLEISPELYCLSEKISLGFLIEMLYDMIKAVGSVGQDRMQGLAQDQTPSVCV